MELLCSALNCPFEKPFRVVAWDLTILFPCLKVRETETMDARWLDYPGSGDLPDDEDIGKFKPPSTSDGLDIDETSGSGGKQGRGRMDLPRLILKFFLVPAIMNDGLRVQLELQGELQSVRWRWESRADCRHSEMRTVKVVVPWCWITLARLHLSSLTCLTASKKASC